jgi:hypothetical protein
MIVMEYLLNIASLEINNGICDRMAFKSLALGSIMIVVFKFLGGHLEKICSDMILYYL